MRKLIEDLIRHGVVYFAFYGPRCEEAHDLADAVRDEWLISTDKKVVMTAPISYLIVEIGESATGDLLSAVREVFL